MTGKAGGVGGFTYIALLIWVAALGTGLAAVGPVWQTLLQRERERELLHIGDQFRTAIKRYHASNRRFPLRLEDMVLDDRHPGIKRHLRRIFADPMTRRAEWGTIRLADGQIIGIHSLSEETPLKKAGFRAIDAAFEGKTRYSEWIFAAAIGSASRQPQPENAERRTQGMAPRH